ncbi:MAG: NAD(P)-dependent alcohol dehydrogenase [bacterium]|nr:NAD(P)-dependent alcohol dehydrogenase [bacterium]MCP4968646.1 NAD(P)-dependent alcohol dehydrogenase [bacterium]
MKAIVQHKYGEPQDVLQLSDVAKPSVKDDEVLVRVRAASIHIGDVHMIRGRPSMMRPIFSMLKAKNGVPGTDIAGTVEEVGKSVTTLQPGDDVFGPCKGAFAEYVAVSADSVAPRPSNRSFEETSAIGTSALTALQALRDKGKVQPGHKVLVTGASGGVGTFAVQIAKSLGAEVTGVCSTRNLEMVRSIGADHVVDYTQQSFTEGDRRYDLILDNVGIQSMPDIRRVLTPGGKLLSNGAPVGGFVGGLGHPLKAMVTSLFVRQQGRPFVSLPKREDLITLTELAESGEVVPVMDRTFPLEQAPAALAHVGEGHAQGKTVITM